MALRGDEHEPVLDDQSSDEDASAGTQPDHQDPAPSTDETPRRH